MYNILTTIKKYLNGWEPTDIFYFDNYTYTRLGRWFKDAPDIVSLLKIFWYIPAWTVYIVANIIWNIIELFLSSKVKAWL